MTHKNVTEKCPRKMSQKYVNEKCTEKCHRNMSQKHVTETGTPTEAPKKALRPPTEARQLHDQSSIEHTEETSKRNNMLPINFISDGQATLFLQKHFRAIGPR